MFLAFSFCQQAATMSAYKFTPRVVASPDAPQKPLVRKRARSVGVRWVQVHEPGSQAKKAPYNRFTATCMHPPREPDFDHQFRFGISGGSLCSAPSHASSKFQLCAQKCDHLNPPPNNTFLKRHFLTDFKKYTHTPPPPPTEQKFGAIDQKSRKAAESAKTHRVGAF